MTTATAATLAAAIHCLRQTATKPDATLAELHKAAQTLHNNASYEADSSLVFVGVDDYERLMRLLGIEIGGNKDVR